jgi:hypothetical protein
VSENNLLEVNRLITSFETDRGLLRAVAKPLVSSVNRVVEKV